MASHIRGPAKVLARIIDSSRPHGILFAGELAASVVAHWARHHPEAPVRALNPAESIAGVEDLSRYDLALLSEELEHLDHAAGLQWLGSLRNYGVSGIAVMVRDDGAWAFGDFIRLGFRRHAQLANEGMTLYSYHLDSYNHKRAWNNPRHWANPELWGKHWW